MLESQRAALEIRARLHNPPNAHRDDGIDLKNLKKYKPIGEPEPQPMPPRKIEPVAPVPTPEEFKWARTELSEIEQRLLVLQSKVKFMRERSVDWYPALRDIQEAVCLRYSIKYRDLISARRTANLVRPRQIAMYLCKILTLRSLPQIGRAFGGRDHTTSLHAIRKITRLKDADPALAAALDELAALFGPGPVAELYTEIAPDENTVENEK